MNEPTSPELLAGASEIVRVLRDSGHEAFWAGGAVRDALLGRKVEEIDIATSAPPQDIESLFARTVPVGRQFGVIIVIQSGFNFEVTTFRRESGYEDGRRPSRVEFTGVEEDARRRDFTVNALYYDPVDRRVLDFVGGQEDLHRRILRTVGEPAQRFGEDRLRMLRAVRLACQLDFEIEPEAWNEISGQASELTQVSWERIRDEILKILTGPDPARGLTLLRESGILSVILPEVAALEGVPQPPEFHPEGDVFVHTRLMFQHASELTPTLALGILLHDVGKPPTMTVRDRIRFDGHAQLGAQMADRICRRLRLSGEQCERVVDLVKDHLRFIHVQDMRESTLKRFLGKENFDEHLELHRLDCLASHGDLTGYDFCKQKLEELSREEIRPAPLIRGRDLIEAGFPPGPIFSEILGQAEDLQLEGVLRTRQEALQWVVKNFAAYRPSGSS